MGMSAEIIAIGPFSQDIVHLLPFTPERFAATREGAVIAVSLFGQCSGNSESRALAACFAIDPWRFEEHRLDLDKVDVEALTALRGEDAQETLTRLHQKGYQFYFQCNG